MEGVIYKYTNKVNGKVYIGQTISEIKRKSRHKSCKDNNYFHNAIKKYGWENFEYEVIDRIDLDPDILHKELDELECKYIIEYKSNDKEFGYNLTTGGEGGHHLNDEVKDRLSSIQKGKHYSPDTEFKIGFHHTDETKRKISKSLIGNTRCVGRIPWNKGMKCKIVDGKRVYTKSNI